VSRLAAAGLGAQQARVQEARVLQPRAAAAAVFAGGLEPLVEGV